mmetsp:Transcript_4025/g.7703  ORF Transcript_4025/g.7703 Transcript_4025/m.7703 type:complete len:313 (-) Transcript_4025:285-1223(-)
MGITYSHGYVTPLMLYNGLNHPFSDLVVVDIRGAARDRPSVGFAVVAGSPLDKHRIGAMLSKTINELRMRDVHLVLIGDSKEELCKIPSVVGRAMSIAEKNCGKFARISILQGGYTVFAQQWGIMCTDHPRYEHGRIYPNCVWEGEGGQRLFVSNYGMAIDPKVYEALEIRSVINCTPEVPFVDEIKDRKFVGKLRKMRIAIVDTPEESDKLVAMLDKACTFIDEGLKEDKCVLVHCKHGQSRSVAVATAWMMSRQKISFADAHGWIKSRRPQARTKFEDPLKRWAAANRTSGEQEPSSALMRHTHKHTQRS